MRRVCEFAFCAVDFFAGGFFDTLDGSIDKFLKRFGDELQIRVTDSWSCGFDDLGLLFSRFRVIVDALVDMVGFRVNV